MKRLGRTLARLLRRTGNPSVDRAATWLERRWLRRKRAASAGNAAAELREIARYRARGRVPVRQPFVLISQVHRSGGTLLQRLLDGHPELHVFSHEVGALLTERAVPLEPAKAWRTLHDAKLARRFERGLRQQGRELNRDESATAFLLPPTVHRGVFDAIVDEERPGSERALLDAYVTAYFNAWLDYRGPGEKRWIAGFEPQLIDQPGRLETFWRLYPDGRLITILRDPASWYASARRWAARFEQLDVALALWRASALAAERQLADERVLGLLFEDLVTSPETTMRTVAAFLEIEFDEVLLAPTANGVPFGANSSFETPEPGSVGATAADRRSLLAPEELATIDREAGEVYEAVRRVIAGRLPSPS